VLSQFLTLRLPKIRNRETQPYRFWEFTETSVNSALKTLKLTERCFGMWFAQECGTPSRAV